MTAYWIELSWGFLAKVSNCIINGVRGKAAHLEIYANLQQGKTYFSITTKEGVQQYLDFRKRDVELGHIVKGRHATIATHLQHWLNFIGKDTKLKELERTDCQNYFYHRQKSTNSKVKQVTVQNERYSSNAPIDVISPCIFSRR